MAPITESPSFLPKSGTDHSDKLSSGSTWKWLHVGSGLKEKSCPPNDDINKVKPWQVTQEWPASLHAPRPRSLFLYIPPQLCSLMNKNQLLTNLNNNTNPLRILLAIHGYSGRPKQEIKKWQETALSLNAIIIAPQGTKTVSDHNNLGWNAIDCCGDPVINEIDDVEFIMNGAVEVLLNVIGRRSNVHVIATGFSNGGFMSSELGLLSPGKRPSWLVGIVPTGGYQYNVEMYIGVKQPKPLPIFSHHAGRDSIVIPTGCCQKPTSSSIDSESICVLDIGIKQKECTSVQNAFEMWSRINGCSSTVLDEDITNDRRMLKKVDMDQESVYTCYKGIDCLPEAPTNFCMWNKEGHAWGFRMPGVNMTKNWMEEVFQLAETRSSGSGSHVKDPPKSLAPDTNDNINVMEDQQSTSIAPAITPKSDHPKKGKLVFSTTFAGMLILTLLVLSSNKVFCFMKRKKRKTSDADNATVEHLIV